MNGIDPSVIAKLSDKPIPKATFDVLRKNEANSSN